MNIYFSFRIWKYSFNFNLSFSKSNQVIYLTKQNYGNKNHKSGTAGRCPDRAES